MEKKSLLDDAPYAEIMARVEKLSADSTPLWGKMTVGQMLSHCTEVQEVANGKPLEGTPFIARLFKGMIKKMLLNNKRPPHNIKTHPQYVVSTPADFEEEKRRLVASMASFRANGPTSTEHPLFGPMTNDEWGWLYFKHMNHHLEQFGV